MKLINSSWLYSISFNIITFYAVFVHFFPHFFTATDTIHLEQLDTDGSVQLGPNYLQLVINIFIHFS